MLGKDITWARATLLGIAAMAGAGAFGILMRCLGFLDFAGAEMSAADIVIVILFVLAVLPTIILPIRSLRGTWLVILAICILPITPFALMTMTRVQPFGPITAMALTDARPPGGLETGIRITDAAPRRDAARSVGFTVSTPGRRGGSHPVTHRYQVAPVVPAPWRPGMPVRVWAVVDGATEDAGWDSASGALFRPIDLSLAERAVRQFRAERRAPGPMEPEPALPVIGLWVADADAARLAQVTLWARILGGASLAWALLAWVGMRARPAATAAAASMPSRTSAARRPPRWRRWPR